MICGKTSDNTTLTFGILQIYSRATPIHCHLTAAVLPFSLFSTSNAINNLIRIQRFIFLIKKCHCKTLGSQNLIIKLSSKSLYVMNLGDNQRLIGKNVYCWKADFRCKEVWEDAPKIYLGTVCSQIGLFHSHYRRPKQSGSDQNNNLQITPSTTSWCHQLGCWLSISWVTEVREYAFSSSCWRLPRGCWPSSGDVWLGEKL